MKQAWTTAASWAVLALAAATAAQAQETPPPDTPPADGNEVEAVVVTGSRIRTTALERDQPIVQIGREDIDKTGLTSTSDVLQRIPSAGGGLNSKFNNSGNFGNPPNGAGVGAGSAEIDLRYLGSQRVLVLVDGLRWVSGSAASGVPGSVDLNTIPPEMISRIEVLQEGASPIYGSDAIAGVVNIITKERQDGFQASAQIGGYAEESDGFSQDYNMSWGISEDRTRVVVGGGYLKQEPVFAADRDISLFPSPYATDCLAGGCSSGTLLGRFIVSDPNTGQDLDLTLRQALAPGQRPTYNPANPTGPGSQFKNFETLDRFNFQPFNYIQIPSERFSAFGSLTHDFNDNVSFRVRTTYVQRRSANQAGPLPLFIGPDAGNGNLLDTIAIDASNPFSPFGFTLQPGTYAFVGRRLIENGPRNYQQSVDTWNVTATLDGELPWGERTWFWDVNAVISRNKAQQSFTGNVNAQRVAQALGPIAGCTGSCVPLNVFGGEGTITREMLDFIGFTQQDSSEQELKDFSANLTGDLFQLPAGPLAFAVGVEHRETEGFFQPDAIVAAGLSSDIPAQPTSGAIDVDEAYAELRLPLISDMPFFHELEASVAGRWFDYSTAGTGDAYQARVNWRPIEDLLFRGSWAEGFRAPTIGELFGSASRFDQEVLDPCSDFLGLGGGTPASPAVRANCIAQGVPAGGGYVQLNPQLSVITGGNANLQPETSTGLNFSAVWEPDFLRDTGWSRRGSIELVYSDIELEDAIQGQNAEDLLQRCAQSNDPVACSSITRTASGQVAAIQNPLTNIGGLQMRAIDLNLTYEAPDFGYGRFAMRAYTTFLLEFTEFVPTGGGFAEIEREGTERGSPDQAYPETKSNIMIDWDQANWGATVAIRHISAVDESQAANTLDATTYLDFQVRWRPTFVNDRLAVTAGINNLTNEDPPGCESCGLNNFDPNAYDAPGRFYYLRLSYRPWP